MKPYRIPRGEFPAPPHDPDAHRPHAPDPEDRMQRTPGWYRIEFADGSTDLGLAFQHPKRDVYEVFTRHAYQAIPGPDFRSMRTRHLRPVTVRQSWDSVAYRAWEDGRIGDIQNLMQMIHERQTAAVTADLVFDLEHAQNSADAGRAA